MQRRSFLAGILAGAAAPAIVRASSLMKIWVPPQGIRVFGTESLTLGGPEWFYLNKQGEDLVSLVEDVRQQTDQLCGIPDWKLTANDPTQQAVADRMKAHIRAALLGDSGLSILVAEQQRRDREMQRAMSEMLRKTLDDMLRG